MPGVPLAMPSETVIVLNSTLLAPAASAPAPACRASTSMCMLHGVTMFQVEAMPTCGFAKSSSLNPTARSMARLGACVRPSTTTRECRRGSTPGGSWSCSAMCEDGAAFDGDAIMAVSVQPGQPPAGLGGAGAPVESPWNQYR